MGGNMLGGYTLQQMKSRSGSLAGVMLAAVTLCATPAWSQPTRPTNAVQPTVTVAMGDVGGKFFGQAPDPAKTRHYYLAAEPQLWDYVPEGRDVICGKPLPLALTARRNGSKLRYVQYTDASFAVQTIQTPSLGVLGPVLRGVVGESLAVTFLNRTPRPLSMHPHGLKYDKDSEGAYHELKPGLGAAVGPGAKFTYVWHLDESSGPLASEPSSKVWLYHSHVNSEDEINLGLIGLILVTDPKRARADGTPNDVDRELATLFMIFDESGLGEEEREAAEHSSAPGVGPARKTWAQVREMIEQGGRHAINGYVFGNLPGLEMNEGERVRWYLVGLGSEQDFHTAHWHGLRVIEEGRRRTDVVELLPATMKVADMVADNPGSWLLHCHVAEHMLQGMFARVLVHRQGSAGAGRSPEESFLGLPRAQQSVQIKRAEAALNAAPNAPNPFELTLEGAVTVFQAFAVSKQPIQIQFGDKSIRFSPDRRGQATTPEGSWRVRNASEYGVVYGGLMEFEVVLTGADWLAEFKKLGLVNGTTLAADLPASFTIQIGTATHSAKARIVPRGK